MQAPAEYYSETHMIGPDCRQHMLDCEHFPSLRAAPFIWLGYSELRQPYRMVRNASVHSHIVVPLSGCGRTVVDGELVDWQPGQVLLGPVGVHHAFEAVGVEPWCLAWVFYDDDTRSPVLRGRRAELVTADGAEFVSVLRMLLSESAGAAEPAMMSAIVALLDACARRLACGDAVDPRLQRLWAAVEADLAYPWGLPDMARLACMSEEHLRRLCRRHYQHSPASHLAYLRMRRAATMLRATSELVDEIARRVGYASMYSFSVAFRRWSGVPPTVFRAHPPFSERL